MSSVTPAPSAMRQRGVALLLAMLIVAILASFAAATTWQQRRSAHAEADERDQQQARWLISGALNWARLVLVLDAEADRRSGHMSDNLNEPWAVPLAESRLGTFLAADNNVAQGANADLDNAFFSGAIVDLNSRLNVTNLAANDTLDQLTLAQFQRLFQSLDLPPQLATTMADNYLLSLHPGLNAKVPLTPACVDELVWLGLSAAQVERIRPYVVVLPRRTGINLNTASDRVLAAALPEQLQSAVGTLVAARTRAPFLSLDQARSLLGAAGHLLSSNYFQVTSDFFMVGGHIRLDDIDVRDRYVVSREGLSVRTVRRQCYSPFAPIETTTGRPV